MNTLIDEIFAKFSTQSDDKGITLTWSTKDSVTEAKSELLKAILEVVGDDEEIPMENRMSDIEQVRLFNQVSKAVYGRNALRAELRTKFKALFGENKEE